MKVQANMMPPKQMNKPPVTDPKERDLQIFWQKIQNNYIKEGRWH